MLILKASMNLDSAKDSLLEWYAANKRPLPWRANRDPYRIWISETMLQQTTTTAVIPYFERFVHRFPTLGSLAEAPESAVLEAWAGLGYYSRARNLHKSAKALHARGGFPRTHTELMELPGFGPYTARSVASLAFDESVGVVDGNVIRVLSRVYGRDWQWWQGKIRQQIQVLVDEWVTGVASYDMNQALMELGRTICTPKQVTCLLCPLRPQCSAHTQDKVTALPLPKPRREREIWQWDAEVCMKSGRILLIKNTEIPFLKGHWVLPGAARLLKKKPAKFHYKHCITHHDIYVTVTSTGRKADGKWVALKEIRQYAPTSIVDKAITFSGSGLQAKPAARRSGASRSQRTR